MIEPALALASGLQLFAGLIGLVVLGAIVDALVVSIERRGR